MARIVSVRVIIDSNIFFSSIFYPDGNERRLFELADRGLWQIVICDYVFDEIQLVLKRKGIEPNLAVDLLDTYQNIVHMDLDPEKYIETLGEATRLVSDDKDRPVFIFAKQEIEKDRDTFLVSGDRHLNTPEVKKALDDRVFKTKEFFKLMKIE